MPETFKKETGLVWFLKRFDDLSSDAAADASVK